jgi:hypothetical protein
MAHFYGRPTEIGSFCLAAFSILDHREAFMLGLLDA